jgi:23S rRNA (pseudouridine1915-N3)-methyltransferase
MQINILAIESSRPVWAEEAFNSYTARFNKNIRITWKGIKPFKINSNSNTNKIIEEEGRLLLSNIKNKGLVICLDKSGKSFDTLKFKKKFETWCSLSNEINFLIGGPDGLSRECFDKSHESWSLSLLTFPHAMVPVIVMEQLYRVWSIQQSHPYHR